MLTRSVVALTLVAQLLAACSGGGPSSASPTAPAATSATAPAVTNPTALATTSPTASPAPRSTTPVARGYHALIGLGDRGVLLVGGSTAIPRNGGKALSDPWIYRQGKWVAADAGIPSVLADATGYDAKSERAIVLAFSFSRFEQVSVSATWVYDPATDRWVERPEAGRPPLTDAARGAYDRRADRLIVLDGAGKTWSYDVDANQWTDRSPQVAPPHRRYYAMVYDEASDRTILFGGDDQADTWAYDFGANTWTEMRPALSPPGRKYHAMAYDPTSDRTVLFGGAAGPQDRETPFADTWTYDYETNTWTELTPQQSPGARGWHAMAYDAPSLTILLFGGGADRDHFLADTWVFDPARRAWSSVP